MTLTYLPTLYTIYLLLNVIINRIFIINCFFYDNANSIVQFSTHLYTYTHARTLIVIKLGLFNFT